MVLFQYLYAVCSARAAVVANALPEDLTNATLKAVQSPLGFPARSAAAEGVAKESQLLVSRHTSSDSEHTLTHNYTRVEGRWSFRFTIEETSPKVDGGSYGAGAGRPRRARRHRTRSATWSAWSTAKHRRSDLTKSTKASGS